MILSGLDAHQSIVISANFLLDSESQLQAASGLNSAVPAPAMTGGTTSDKQVTIDFTVNQNQLRKGANGVQVKVTNSQGAPVPDADVTVTSYMPAMPAMGMAAVQLRHGS